MREVLGLLHVLRRQQHGCAVGDEVLDEAPDVVAGTGVQAGGRLVEDAKGGLERSAYLMGVQSISMKTGLGAEATDVIDAVIYGRASKDRLRLLRSIGDQIADCRTWCEPLGWRVVDVITDADRSASQWRRKEREGFEVALGLIESGQIQGFVTWEPSRAGRDLAIYVQLRAACQRAGVLYLTQGRVYDFSRSDDSFMMGFEFLRAEADANTMRERQLRTARRNAEKGRPHGRLAFGYRRVYDERTGVLV
ncbi:MAG: recombinase family protein, partial [Solirubrobacteraceae bacterium]